MKAPTIQLIDGRYVVTSSAQHIVGEKDEVQLRVEGFPNQGNPVMLINGMVQVSGEVRFGSMILMLDGDGLLLVPVGTAEAEDTCFTIRAPEGYDAEFYLFSGGYGFKIETTPEGHAVIENYSGNKDIIFESANVEVIRIVGTGETVRFEQGVLVLKETTTPTPLTDYGAIYTKNDNKLYFQDGAGNEHEVAFA